MGKEDLKTALQMTRPPSLLLHPLPYLLSHPNIRLFPPSTGSGRKRVSLCPLSVSDLREILKDLASYIDAPDQYLQPLCLWSKPLHWQWKDITLLVDQTLFSLEKQWVRAQATQIGDDFHLQWAPIPVAPETEVINVPIPTGAQGVPLADTHWDQNGEEDE
jgi:hypothetical protein